MFLRNKAETITASTDAKKLITKSKESEYSGAKTISFEVPDDYVGCLIYNKESYVFYPEDYIIPQAKEPCTLPRAFFTKGKNFKFYLINLNYQFDTIKTAVLDQYYYKETMPEVEIKCSFRIDLHIKLLKTKKRLLMQIVKKHADKIEDLQQIIQEEVSPIFHRIVKRCVEEGLANTGHKIEIFSQSENQDQISQKVVLALKEELSEYAVKPYELTLNLYTPEEGEKRLTKINDIMFDKALDDLEHKFHDERRKDIKEDREFEVKLGQTGNKAILKENEIRCPYCQNIVDKKFPFCPYCQKELKNGI